MIHITYYPSTNNLLSSGHIFWEIFTTFIFSYFLDGTPIHNDSWNNSSIISSNSLKYHCANKLENYDNILTINNYTEWGSLNKKQFDDIIENILNLKKKYNNILIIFKNVCKIHPDIIYYWYKENLIPNDVYSLYLKPKLQELYFYDNESKTIDQVAIHIRRGDLAKWCYDIGFTLDYYKNIINILNEHLNIKINIYCEDGFTNRGGGWDKTVLNFDYNDIDILKTYKNVNIVKGNPTGSDFNKHLNELIRSKILIMSPSSFSLWAGFITRGKVLIDEKCIIHRVNLFKHSKIIPNFIVYENFIDVIKNIKTI